jgi:DNA polymerase I-like protein with 3'-5' exonuclease and polymerase domains
MNIHPKTHEAYQLFHKGILALARAEMQGFRVDVPYVEKKLNHLQRKMERCEQKFKDSNFFHEWERNQKGKVNINSSTQLANFLYKVKGYAPPKYTAKSTEAEQKGSTDEEALKQLGIPEIDLLLEKNKVKKSMDVLNGFFSEQVDGYIHPFYNLHIARTFRSSSDSPNFQNIPKRDEEMQKVCRKSLYPRPGHQLMEIDFGQLEVRISACYNKDEKLIADILHGDMHTDMAKEIFMIDNFDKSKKGHATLRQAAKNGFIFAEFYGDYFKNCAENVVSNWGQLPKTGKWKYGQGIIIDEIGKPFKPYYLSDHLISKGITEFGSIKRTEHGLVTTGFLKHMQEIENNFWNVRYRHYKQWKEDQFTEYQQQGYVDLYTGFRCSGVMNKKETSNYPVQGSAFHCLLWLLIAMDEFIYQTQQLDTRIIGQIHDSLILDVNPNELKYIVEKVNKIIAIELPKAWPWICLPLEIDAELCPVNASWYEKEKFSLS